MKHTFTLFLTLMSLVALPLSSISAQVDFEFCGSTFTVNCDGTVDVDLADNVNIYKVWNGGNLIAELNNFTNGPNVIYDPFNSAGPGLGNPVPPGENYYIDVQTEDCGDFVLNISEVLRENCPTHDDTPQTFEFCGSTFTVNCDGTVDVDLDENVFIYKVWNGGTLVAEWNNFTGPPVEYDPFNSADPGFGFPVPPGQNFYLDVQTEDCGVFVLNISQILRDNCGFALRDASDGPAMMQPLDKQTLNEKITAFPNPTSGDLTVKLPQVEDRYTISIYDFNGRLLEQRFSQGGNILLPFNRFVSGMYILDVRSNELLFTERIQVTK